MSKKYFILTLLLVGYLAVNAQNNNKPEKIFKARILDETTKESIPSVNIFNESQKKWSISASDGTCQLKLNDGDTLVLTMIGYLGKVVIADKPVSEEGLTILLTPRKYDIEEVTVFGYRNYDDFQKAFKSLELPESQSEIIKKNLSISGTNEALAAVYEKTASEKMNTPYVGIRLNRKDGFNAKELQRKEQMQYVANKKFNRDMVNELTKLEGYELTNFIGYCNFSLEYLYNASEYEIICEILKKFETFKSESQQNKTGGMLNFKNLVINVA